MLTFKLKRNNCERNSGLTQNNILYNEYSIRQKLYNHILQINKN